MLLGRVNLNEWKRAISKLGITSVNDENLNKIFESYATNLSVDYKEFILVLYPVQNTEKDVSVQGSVRGDEVQEESINQVRQPQSSGKKENQGKSNIK